MTKTQKSELSTTSLGWYGKLGWFGLLLLGLFPIFASVSDLAKDLRSGLPKDHVATFVELSGQTFQSVSPGTAHYIKLLETGYAVHELVFGIFFLAIVLIPLRQGRRWAWFTCWAILIADIVYSLTFGHYDKVILRQSLLADILTPVFLVLIAVRYWFAHKS